MFWWTLQKWWGLKSWLQRDAKYLFKRGKSNMHHRIWMTFPTRLINNFWRLYFKVKLPVHVPLTWVEISQCFPLGLKTFKDIFIVRFQFF